MNNERKVWQSPSTNKKTKYQQNYLKVKDSTLP